MTKKYHPLQERIVDILVEKTQTNNRHFFRLLVVYHFAVAAAMMRAMINTKDRGIIPVNLYIINLLTSGQGKNFSLNIIEEELMIGFKRKFLDGIFKANSEIELQKIAEDRSVANSTEYDVELAKVTNEFEALGQMAFNFDSGTVPAIKQLRQKLLIAKTGSINLVVDEIGSNLLGNNDVLTAYLELYDVGSIKQKLIKNTKENTRMQEIEGRTPCNAMLFGTPDKLLDGAKVEQEFDMMLMSGYGRRLLFGFSTEDNRDTSRTAEEVYDRLTDGSLNLEVQKIIGKFSSLADPSNFNMQVDVPRDIGIAFIDYRLQCERKATDMGSHEEDKKAQMIHRYFNALKMAGAYAFVDGTHEMTQDQLDYAKTLVDDSGEHYARLQNRERPYVRLAKYLGYIDHDVTMVDLTEELPFFSGTIQIKQQLITMATAYGYRNNIIIKQREIDGIEFFSGESLEETNLDEMTISYSNDIARSYKTDKAPFYSLNKLLSLDSYHYAAHGFYNGHRTSDNAIPGFNLLILDIDDGTTITMVKQLLSDYSFIISTTKRHTSAQNRFRLIMPLSHILKLDPKTYSSFMTNIFLWLPFKVDEAPKDIARKWETCKSTKIHSNKGKTIDATKFVPKTKRAMQQRSSVTRNQSMNKLQRWFAKNIGIGNRSAMMFRYGMCMMENNHTIEDARNSLLEFNAKISNPLDVNEIENTIFKSIERKYNQNGVS